MLRTLVYLLIFAGALLLLGRVLRGRSRTGVGGAPRLGWAAAYGPYGLLGALLALVIAFGALLRHYGVDP